VNRLAIAHLSPLPPQRSGIAAYCAALLPHLARHVDVTVYASETVEPALAQQFNVRPLDTYLAERARYDFGLYHIGNHPAYHRHIYAACLRQPGLAVLHEADLFAFFWNWPDAARQPFVREMAYTHGLEGLQLARTMIAEGQPAPLCAAALPLIERLARVSLGLIVHTSAARERVLAIAPHARVAQIPLAAPVIDPASPDRPALFSRGAPLGSPFPPQSIVVGALGYLAPSKRLEVLLRAVAQLRGACPQLRVILIGAAIDGYDLSAEIDRLGLGGLVHIAGYVADADYGAYAQAIDIGVNLRTAPTGGEMSATLVHLLAAARPTLVSNVEGFAALPDDAVIKIDQDAAEVDRVAAALQKLSEQPELRQRYGSAARRYAASTLTFSQVAQAYADFMADCRAAIVTQVWA
jgi:glycosyltransferase involved in cell wall biosynthesis